MSHATLWSFRVLDQDATFPQVGTVFGKDLEDSDEVPVERGPDPGKGRIARQVRCVARVHFGIEKVILRAGAATVKLLEKGHCEAEESATCTIRVWF